jgi:hypothetical protein
MTFTGQPLGFHSAVFGSRQGPQDHADLLHSTLQQGSQFLLILLGNVDLQGLTTHTPSMRQNNSA